MSIPTHAALTWLLHRSPNILLIPGISSVKHLRENLGAADLAISGDIITELDVSWIRVIGERALKPERSGADLELVIYLPHPGPANLEDWLAASGAVAIVRFGLPGKFLTGREFGHRDGARSYLIKPEDVLALNRALTSSIEVVTERQVNPLAK